MSLSKTLCGSIVLSAMLNACIIILPGKNHDDKLARQQNQAYLTGSVTSEYLQRETSPETYVFTLNTGREVKIVECSRDAEALDELINTYDEVKILMNHQCMLQNCLRDSKLDITLDQVVEVNGHKIINGKNHNL